MTAAALTPAGDLAHRLLPRAPGTRGRPLGSAARTFRLQRCEHGLLPMSEFSGALCPGTSQRPNAAAHMSPAARLDGPHLPTNPVARTHEPTNPRTHAVRIQPAMHALCRTTRCTVRPTRVAVRVLDRRCASQRDTAVQQFARLVEDDAQAVRPMLRALTPAARRRVAEELVRDLERGELRDTFNAADINKDGVLSMRGACARACCSARSRCAD